MNVRLTRTRRRVALTWILDSLVPKRRTRVTFVCKRRFGFSGNLRTVCLALARRGVHEIYLWCETELPRDTSMLLERCGVTLLSGYSLRNALRLASSGIVVVDHSIRDAYVRRKCRSRSIVNLWHGVPIKNIEGLRQLTEADRRTIKENAELYDVMIASSARDREAIAAAFAVPRSRVHVTGLPRYDLLYPETPLDSDLLEQQTRLLERLGGRRLVLYAPTFREAGPSPLALIAQKEWHLLGDALQSRGAVLGVRKHPYDTAACPEDHPGIIELSAKDYPETNLLLRYSDILITDFSSIWIDYVLLSRPIAGFAADRERYGSDERGFIYDFDDVFPGPFLCQVNALAAWLVEQLSRYDLTTNYPLQRELFHSNLKPSFSERCVDLILQQVAARAEAGWAWRGPTSRS